MQQPSITRTATRTATRPATRHLPPMRLLLATLVVAVAGSMAQTAIAGPHGGMGGHDTMADRGHHEGMMGGPGMVGMGGMHQPRHMDRLLDSVNATAEQRAQIKQITDAARADLNAQRDTGRKLHEQGQALFLQPNVDARAVEALRQQMLAQHDQASKRMTQAMLDVSKVLTPEQRKAMGERMAQRRSMMQRHRAERDAAAAPAKK
jgi:Spy/CpxP family protein refolding chaperone